MSKPDCMACNGIGRRGMYEPYILPCAYCNGSGKAKDKADNISIGLRCGVLNRPAIQTNLEFLQVPKESCIQLQTHT